MDLYDVMRTTPAVREFTDDPLPDEILHRILDNALRAPSAGFSQGWAFLVLDTREDVARYWRSTAGDRVDDPDRWLRGMMTAPVVIVPLSHKDAYLDRYAEPDKGWTDRDEARWPVPYWDVDAGMAALLMLLTAVDEGLGACFFGVPTERVDGFRAAFGVPGAYRPVGCVSVGYPGDDDRRSPSLRRGRRGVDEVVHRGRW